LELQRGHLRANQLHFGQIAGAHARERIRPQFQVQQDCSGDIQRRKHGTTFAPQTSTTAQTLTITSDYLVVGGLRVRLDYRSDFGAEPIFPSSSGVDKKSQTTLTVGLVYGFGGKI
jgi:hypothetical protein